MNSLPCFMEGLLLKKPLKIVLILAVIVVIIVSVYNLLGGKLWLVRMTIDSNLPDWLIL